MSSITGMITGLGGLFDPNGVDNINQQSAGIDQTLDPNGAFQHSGDMGAAGSALSGQASQLGSTIIHPNVVPMTQDANALGNLAGIFGNLGVNGGQAEAAAVQQAVGDIAATPLQQLRAQSRAQSQMVTDVANTERGNNLAGATKSSAQEAATKLQALVYQASANHANHVSTLQAQADQNALLNAQRARQDQLYEAALGARVAQTGGAMTQQQQAFNAGLPLASGILAGTAGAAALVAPTFTQQAAQTYTTDASGRVGGIMASIPAPVAGYGSAGYQTGYSTPVMRTSTPYSATNTVYPVSASAPGDWLTGQSGLLG